MSLAGHDALTTTNGRTSIDVERPIVPAELVNRNVRELLGRYGAAPDPIRQGDTPSRPSMSRVAFYFLPGGGFWEEPALGGKLMMPKALAWQPRGQLIADTERMNIDRPYSAPTAETLGWDGTPAYAPAMPGG